MDRWEHVMRQDGGQWMKTNCSAPPSHILQWSLPSCFQASTYKCSLKYIFFNYVCTGRVPDPTSLFLPTFLTVILSLVFFSMLIHKKVPIQIMRIDLKVPVFCYVRCLSHQRKWEEFFGLVDLLSFIGTSTEDDKNDNIKTIRIRNRNSLYGSGTLQTPLGLCNHPHFHLSYKTQPYPSRKIDMKKNEKVPPIHPTAPYVFQIL
jgi:hypothetical protein